MKLKEYLWIIIAVQIMQGIILFKMSLDGQSTRFWVESSWKLGIKFMAALGLL